MQHQRRLPSQKCHLRLLLLLPNSLSHKPQLWENLHSQQVKLLKYFFPAHFKTLMYKSKKSIRVLKNKLCVHFTESIQGLNIQEGDIFFALATFVSETGEAMNLVEGEKVHVLEWNNTDWWYVRKHLTEESGWVPAQYLKDEQTYTMYVQKKLVEKIEKLPVFDSKHL